VGEMRFTPPLISSSSSPCFSFELLDWPPCNCLSSSQPDKSRSGQLLQQHIFVGTTRAFEAAFNQRHVKKRNAECRPFGSRGHHEQEHQQKDQTQQEVSAHLPLLLHLVPVQPVLLPPGHSNPLSVLKWYSWLISTRRMRADPTALTKREPFPRIMVDNLVFPSSTPLVLFLAQLLPGKEI